MPPTLEEHVLYSSFSNYTYDQYDTFTVQDPVILDYP